MRAKYKDAKFLDFKKDRRDSVAFPKTTKSILGHTCRYQKKKKQMQPLWHILHTVLNILNTQEVFI